MTFMLTFMASDHTLGCFKMDAKTLQTDKEQTDREETDREQIDGEKADRQTDTNYRGPSNQCTNGTAGGQANNPTININFYLYFTFVYSRNQIRKLKFFKI